MDGSPPLNPRATSRNLPSTAASAAFAAFVLALLVTAAAPPAWARRAGIAAAGCDGCHSGGRAPTVSITASPMNPEVGQPTILTISVSQTNGPVAGFFLGTEDVNKGTFRALEPGTLATAAGVTHTTPRTGSGGTTVFRVEWSTAMATGVNFAVYALSGNGDGTTRGDAGGEAHMGLVAGCTGTTYYLDQDGDGFGTADPLYLPRMDCTKPLSYAAQSGDCNDFNAIIFPGAPELCDGKDNNCDGKIDEAVVNQMYCEDKDGDGHGVLGGATKIACAPSVGFGDCKGDCSDVSAAVYPGAVEICDGRDNNCNGNVDEGVRKTCGMGWCRRYADGCSTTCTPGEPMAETCNFFDDDCDGVNDNGTDAQLCGASGLACVLGRCIPDDGAGATSTGGTAGSPDPVTGSGGRSGTGASGAIDAGAGSGGTGTGAGPAESGGSAGGCAIIPARPGGTDVAAIALALMFLAAAWSACFRRSPRRRTPLSVRQPPR